VRTAYVDESYDLTNGFYLLCATVVRLGEAEQIRDALRALRYGSRKLHWQSERHPRRLDLAKSIGSFGADHLVVVGRAKRLRAERARRKCMETLLAELDQRQISIVIFEERQGRNNQRDMELVAACRRKRLITQRLGVDFGAAGSEPLLWLPDIACGAIRAAEHGQGAYLELVEHTIQRIDIDAG
jgi:Protein of unknown function (DUF3800)